MKISIKRWLMILCFLCMLCLPGIYVSAQEERNTEEEQIEESVVNWIVQKITDGEVDISDEQSIRQAIMQAREEFDVSLSTESEDRIVYTLGKISALGLSAEQLLSQTKDLYEKYAAEAVEEMNESINDAAKEAASSAVSIFVERAKEAISNFFRNIFDGF